jgi:hypothetical protein
MLATPCSRLRQRCRSVLTSRRSYAAPCPRHPPSASVSGLVAITGAHGGRSIAEADSVGRGLRPVLVPLLNFVRAIT